LVGRVCWKKKRVKRENDRDFREKGDEGLELDESTLMGGGDSFKAQIARRDMAKRRYEQKHEEKNNAVCESFRLQGERKGYYGYVPAVGKAAIRMKITFILCHCFVHLLIDV